jgi:hypothetical protein
MKIAMSAVLIGLTAMIPGIFGQTSDVGLPIYPGATPDREGDPSHFPGPVAFNNSATAVIDVPVGRARSRVVVVKLRTPDPADRVAAFYRQALAQYGTVLDCSHPESSPNVARRRGHLRSGAWR